MNDKKKRGIALFVMSFILVIFASLKFDKEIIRFFYQIKTPILTEFFLGLTFVSSELIIFFFLTSLFLWQAHKRKWIFPLWFSLFLSVIVSFLLKISVQRLRPFQQGLFYLMPVLESASFSIWNFSFPSFQTMLAFCAVPILYKNFPKFRYIWILFATLIGLSRVYFGLHFLSDVLAGALIGLAIGEAIVLSEQKSNFWEGFYNKLFRK